MLMLGYCIFNLPWLIPPDTIHSFIKISNQHNKKQNLLIADQSVAICIFCIPMVLQKFWQITTVWNICVEIWSKTNQLKSSYRKIMKIRFVSRKFLSFFSMIKQSSPRLIITVLLGTNTKRNTKDTIITELWWCGENKEEAKIK